MVNNDNHEVPEKIIVLVKKLLALSASSNENEAAVAAAKAGALLQKYNLDMSEVIAADVDAKDILVEEYRHVFHGAASNWKYRLSSSIGRTNFCKVIWHTYQGGFSFIGRSHNVEVAKEINAWVAEQMFRMVDDAARAHRNRSNAFRQSFLMGCAQVVINRLETQYYSMMHDKASSSRALVIVNDAAVAVKLKELYPRLGKSSKSIGTAAHRGGYLAGRKAGSEIFLGSRPQKLNTRHQLNGA